MALLISMYFVMLLADKVSQVRYPEKTMIMTLLRAPDFPSLEEICPTCLHVQSPDYDHCD